MISSNGNIVRFEDPKLDWLAIHPLCTLGSEQGGALWSSCLILVKKDRWLTNNCYMFYSICFPCSELIKRLPAFPKWSHVPLDKVFTQWVLPFFRYIFSFDWNSFIKQDTKSVIKSYHLLFCFPHKRSDLS